MAGVIFVLLVPIIRNDGAWSFNEYDYKYDKIPDAIILTKNEIVIYFDGIYWCTNLITKLTHSLKNYLSYVVL
jgi:hypothetical protein